MKRLVPACLLFLALLACNKPYSPNYPSHLSLNEAEPLGCLLASISRNTAVEPHFRTYEFIFRSRDAAVNKISTLYRADYSYFSAPEDDTFYTDFDENGFAGLVYARNVPVGNYFLEKGQFIGQAVRLEASKIQTATFEIKPGQCVYVGELQVTPVVGKGLMGRDALKSVELNVKNAWTRDQAIFQKIFPELRPDRVEISILGEGGARRMGASTNEGGDAG